jgi:hypothetical protein
VTDKPKYIFVALVCRKPGCPDYEPNSNKSTTSYQLTLTRLSKRQGKNSATRGKSRQDLAVLKKRRNAAVFRFGEYDIHIFA